uniref:Uncharacterized protein n=1 Tax=Chromera velia CCMP2878 TaxID=1169474 RepID=A0A0G4F3E2_9ALVE|eukprot:Cvel_14766.t1-p1 / transcript=Cvel_14766.t1 / gene=Cvel_14766 / organism=Chromera_velia_CCMP2878 / gene_product=hypothetical protein / transcript_product=hypothetical protein / location=Cvel_scaffold1063:26610-27724(+) / protein_length=269 / sequence_SO=supercontig / SO=protein_coding / is_pseudo=false
MRGSLLFCCLLFLIVKGGESFLVQRSPPKRTATLQRADPTLGKNAGTGVKSGSELKDFGPQATALFNSYRVPASLVAGAAFGGAFSLPLQAADDLLFQMVKRTYILIAMGTVASQIIVIVASTMAIEKIGVQHPESRVLAADLREYLQKNLDVEWSAVRLDFLLGLIGFAIMGGVRVWVAFECPRFAKMGLLVIATSVALVSAVIDEAMGEDTVGCLIADFFGAWAKRVYEGKPLYILAAAMMAYSFYFLVGSYIDAYSYLKRLKLGVS